MEQMNWWLALILVLIPLAFAIVAAGLVTWGMAYLVLRATQASSGGATTFAVLASWIVCITLAITVYARSEGPGGLFEGFGAFLLVCLLSLPCALLFGWRWARRRTA